MSAFKLPEAMSPLALKNPLQPLSLWACNPAAEADLEAIFGSHMNWATTFQHLAAFRRADFSLLPPIRTLSAIDMPGLWGGYSRDTREIYLSADCPAELLSAVLIEEIGHFLDQEICAEETPGEEGARFAATVLGLTLDDDCRDDSLAPLFLEGRQLLVEAARKLRGSSKGRSSGKSRGKRRGSSNQLGSNSGGGPGYAEVGGSSSNPKLQESIVYATQDGARIPQKAAGDRLIGSRGNDTFAVMSQDVKIEDPSGGSDTVMTSVSFSLQNYRSIENLSAAPRSGSISLIGNLKANIISGNESNNRLYGGNDLLADTLQGGNGNDTYVIGDKDTLDVVIELPGQGSDTIETTIASISLGAFGMANVENLTFAGTGSSTLVGNDLANLLTGGSGADTLFGESGDTLAGGQGDDWFKVLDQSVYIVEGFGANDGNDTISTAIANYSLAALRNIEVLDYTGSRNSTLTGNSDGNLIFGGLAAKNSIAGAEGNDYLVGGSDWDTLSGGVGNDTLVVTRWEDTPVGGLGTTLRAGGGRDSLDGGAGSDWYVVNSQSAYTFRDTTLDGNTVATTVDFSLKHNNNIVTSINNLYLIGKSNLRGTGSDISNAITGNDGSNVISAEAGNDLVEAGLGADYVLGGDGNDTLFGGGQPQSNLPNDASNTLVGGLGDDYLVAGNGRDSAGNPLGDLLLGGSNLTPGAPLVAPVDGKDTLVGGDGNDTLDGGNGADSLIGGKGDDLYYFRDSGANLIENIAEGLDTLISGVNLNLLTQTVQNIEIYALAGTGNLRVSGSEDSNVIYGNLGNNILTGALGKDSLFGGAGQDSLDGGEDDDYLDGGVSAARGAGDTMKGGSGNDTYVVYNRYDRIEEDEDSLFAAEIDTVYTYVNFDPLLSEDTNNVTRSGSFANNLSSFALLDNFVFMDVADNTLNGGDGPIRGVGNAKNNSFTGNSQNNVILGLDGDDIIIGNAGNDSLYGDREASRSPIYESVSGTYPFNPGHYNVDNVDRLAADSDKFAKTGISGEGQDFLDGGEGNDLLSGNAGNDILIGGEGNDLLLGGLGVDSMVGGKGNDSFYIDNESDVIQENPNNPPIVTDEGDDWAFSSINIFQLQDDIENIVIYGPDAFVAVGNSVDNMIYVGQLVADQVNRVTLSGGSGNDTLKGYFGQQVEVEKILGYAETPAETREMNSRSLGDYLNGGSGNDYVDGGQGIDTLEGGLGNDTIVVGNAAPDLAPDLDNDDIDRQAYDKIWEFGYEGDPVNGGNDWVFTTVNIYLRDFHTDRNLRVNGVAATQLDYVENGMFIENIKINSNDGIEASGNWLNNYILGNLGNDTLRGELADDTLVGDLGNDSLLGGAGKDSLTGASLTFRGFLETDTLTGGADQDRFILGDSAGAYYEGNFDNDYAHIADAGDGADRIMLPGNITQYRFETGNFTAQGRNLGQGDYIYVDNPNIFTNQRGTTGFEDDLIAFIERPGNYTVSFF